MNSRMNGPKKIGKVGPTTSAPKSVATQPAEGTVGMKPFDTGDESNMGDVPHFANNVGKSQSSGGGKTKHWSGR